jgi:hypothetical protein
MHPVRKSAARYPVVSRQLVMTDSVVTRRYRLHRYRGPVVTHRYPYIVTSLHLVVTALYGCRYTSRRYPSLPYSGSVVTRR